MARPFDVPPCDIPPEIRARIWCLALLINKRAFKRQRKAGLRRSRPLPQTALALLDWLLWHAPRRDGGLWHSEAKMAEKLDVDVRSIQRAKAALVRWRLIIVTPRRHSAAFPVRLPGRVVTVHKNMRTSDAISFPNLRTQFPASSARGCRPRLFAAEGRGSFRSQELRGLNGRFIPAAARRAWLAMDDELAAKALAGLARG